MRFEDRFPNFVPLTADELKARGKELSQMWQPGMAEEDAKERVRVDLTVDRIALSGSPEERLAKLRAVFENSSRGTWGTGLSSMGTSEVSPFVGHNIGAPVCRFARPGAPEKDFGDMRFIVAAHGSFEWLLQLATEGLAARQGKTDAE